MKLHRFLRKSLWAVLPKAGWYNFPLAPGHPRTRFSNTLSFCSLYIHFSNCHVKLVLCRTQEEILASRKPFHTALGNTSQPGDILIFCVRWSTKEEPAADHRHWLPSLRICHCSVHGAKWNMGVFPVFTWQYTESTRSIRHGSGYLSQHPRNSSVMDKNSPLCTRAML